MLIDSVGSTFEPRRGDPLNAKLFGDLDLGTQAGFAKFRECHHLGNQLIGACRDSLSPTSRILVVAAARSAGSPDFGAVPPVGSAKGPPAPTGRRAQSRIRSV